MSIFDLFRRRRNKAVVQPEIDIDNQPSEKDLDKVIFENNQHSIEKIVYSPTTTLFDVLNYIRTNATLAGIQLNKQATQNEIEFFENNKIKLPQDFKDLYKFSNGFETNEDLFRLIPLDEIIDNGKDNYCINDFSFHFTDYMIYCDMWSVEINPDDIENYRIYNKADNIVYLTNSLSEFLCVFINKGIYEGLYAWREQKQNV